MDCSINVATDSLVCPTWWTLACAGVFVTSVEPSLGAGADANVPRFVTIG